MIWFFGHASLIVIIIGSVVLAALAADRIAVHAGFYVEIAPVRVRSERRRLS